MSHLFSFSYENEVQDGTRKVYHYTQMLEQKKRYYFIRITVTHSVSQYITCFDSDKAVNFVFIIVGLSDRTQPKTK